MSETTSPGALLMTYGSPTSLEHDDVRAYLARVRGGREPDTELVEEFTRRYRVIGGSPLIEITRRQAAALEASLGWPVEIGMRFSAPSIEDGLQSLADRGVDHVAAIILSPQFSPLLMGGYARAIDDARNAIGDAAPKVTVAGPWHEEPAFIDALAKRVRDGLAALGGDRRVPVFLTAHSLPRHVADQDPDYLDQLRATARLVAQAAQLGSEQWRFGWQSAGHEPGEWMKPDLADLLSELAEKGDRAVLVAPIQFLADHLEILYDIDVAAREQADGAGLGFARVASLNDDPGLVAALAVVAARTIDPGPSELRPFGDEDAVAVRSQPM